MEILKISILVFSLFLCGSIVQRLSGFGLGIVVMAILPAFIPSKDAATIVCIISIFSACFNAITNRKYIVIKTIVPMAISAVIAITPSVLISNNLDDRLYKIILGILLLCLSCYFFIFADRIKLKQSPVIASCAGLLSGALNGMFSTGGPPAALYVSCVQHDKNEYFATMQTYSFIISVYTSILRSATGAVDFETMLFCGAGLLGFLDGNMLGKGLFKKMSDKLVRRTIYVVLFVSGILMIF